MAKLTMVILPTFFLALSVLFPLPIQCDFIYTAVSQKNLRPLSTYSITTSLEKVDSPVTFEFLISSEKNQTIASNELTLSPDSRLGVVELEIGNLLDENYNLTVKASDKDKTSEDLVLLTRDTKNTSILIQTDKPIYKPGETLKYRVFVLNRYLQPFGSDKQITLTITDPRNNIIKSVKSVLVPGSKGFISDQFELSVEPNLGDWTIEAVLDSSTNEKSSYVFSVDQYVLPKYKVGIKLHPSYVTYNESKVKAEVSSIYSYGKPVQGECTLVLKEPYRYYYRSDSDKRVESVIKTVQLEEGKGIAFVDFDIKSELGIERDEVNTYGKDFKIDASCKDKVSGQIRNETISIKMYKYPYKFEIINSVDNIKPGFPLNVTIKVSTQDDIPIGDSNEDALKVEHGFDFTAEGGIIRTSIPPTGLVTIPFVASTNPKVCYEGLDVTYKELKETLWLPSKQISPTGGYMQLKLKTDKLREGEDAEINVRTSKPLDALNILLISRGKVLTSDRIGIDKANNYDATVKLPRYSAPKALLVIYAVFSDSNDVIVDTLKLDIAQDKKNELEISLSDKTLEPGANVSISLKGLPKSIIGLRAVDQSVLLLKKDNDLTNEKLSSIAEEFNNNGNWYSGGSELFQIFTRSGLNILTNAVLEKGQNDYPTNKVHFAPMSLSAEMEYDSDAIPAVERFQSTPASAGAFASAGGGGFVEPSRVRSFFPETWIWEDIESPEGTATLEKIVPDTITSWTISGFQINSEEGLGLAQQDQKLTVFRPFFISLNLPYSIVKGEVLGLQILVHNYLEEPVTAKVTLDNKDKFFKFLENETAESMTKEVSLNASAISSVTFPICPVKFGTMTLNVKGLTKISGDAVSRPLIVKPPGVKHTQNSAVLINLLSNNSAIQRISAIFPEQRVKDADFLKVSVIGDILSGTIKNLEKLIQLPSGCGEQNMLQFVPDIVILDYLNKTGGLTPEIERKAVRFLEKGYQQELTYMRQDGSFSAFGKSDPAGSTWLTAFVTRSFISAKKYITIDDNVIKRSLKFLIRQQNDNGSFAEEGRVHDRSLQGGSGDNQYALTAYTLLTFVEADKAKIDLKKFGNDSIIDKGVKFLIKQTSAGQLKDPYGVILIAHLLHLINHPKKDVYFKMTEELAKIDLANNTKHWEPIKKQEKPVANKPIPKIYQSWEPRIKPATVEMTSYALLTYLLRGQEKLSDSVSIARWLMGQRNAEGGFISTQDTVVGITALAKFAEALSTNANSEAEMNVKTSWGTGANHSYDFYIGKDNKTTLQEYFLPLSSREVELAATGKGTALAQLTWTYYIEAKDTSPAFKLDINMKEMDKGRTLMMKACASYIRGDKSNMAILEAHAPSGYAFDQEELEELRRSKVFARYETEDKDSKLNLYFNSLDSKPVCLDLHAYRVYLVAKHTKGNVLIYDYYDTTQRAQEFYNPPAVPLCDLCNVDHSCEIKNCA